MEVDNSGINVDERRRLNKLLRKEEKQIETLQTTLDFLISNGAPTSKICDSLVRFIVRPPIVRFIVQQDKEFDENTNGKGKQEEEEAIRYFDYLPEELLLSVFSYLDRTSLARCHCVCKLWKEIIHHQWLTRLPFLFENFRLRSQGDPLLPDFKGFSYWTKKTVPKQKSIKEILFMKKQSKSISIMNSKEIDKEINDEKSIKESMVTILIFGDDKYKSKIMRNIMKSSNSKLSEWSNDNHIINNNNKRDNKGDIGDIGLGGGGDIYEFICSDYRKSKTPLRILDCEKKVKKSRKWLHMVEDSIGVIFCFDFIQDESENSTKNTDKYYKYFKKILHIKWLINKPVILLINSNENDERVSKSCGIPSIKFSYFSVAQMNNYELQAQWLTNRFVHANQNQKRAIYRYCTSNHDKNFGNAFSEIIRDILVSTLVDKLF